MVGVLAVAGLACQVGVAALLVEGIRRRNAAVAANGVVALAVALLPSLVPVAVDGVDVPPAVTLWVAGAALLHLVGMLGPYDDVWWYDHLTHAVSAALVAAVVYATFLLGVPVELGSATAAAVATVVLTLAGGLLWEGLELLAREAAERLDVEPVLVVYSWRDTAWDLVFDVAGALLVVLLDVRLFVSLVEQLLASAGP